MLPRCINLWSVVLSASAWTDCKQYRQKQGSDHRRFVRLEAYQAADLVRGRVNNTGADEVVRIWIDPVQYRQPGSNQLQHSTATQVQYYVYDITIEIQTERIKRRKLQTGTVD